jgi:hypothetical protein
MSLEAGKYIGKIIGLSTRAGSGDSKSLGIVAQLVLTDRLDVAGNRTELDPEQQIAGTWWVIKKTGEVIDNKIRQVKRIFADWEGGPENLGSVEFSDVRLEVVVKEKLNSNGQTVIEVDDMFLPGGTTNTDLSAYSAAFAAFDVDRKPKARPTPPPAPTKPATAPTAQSKPVAKPVAATTQRGPKEQAYDAWQAAVKAWNDGYPEQQIGKDQAIELWRAHINTFGDPKAFGPGEWKQVGITINESRLESLLQPVDENGGDGVPF